MLRGCSRDAASPALLQRALASLRIPRRSSIATCPGRGSCGLVLFALCIVGFSPAVVNGADMVGQACSERNTHRVLRGPAGVPGFQVYEEVCPEGLPRSVDFRSAGARNAITIPDTHVLEKGATLASSAGTHVLLEDESETSQILASALRSGEIQAWQLGMDPVWTRDSRTGVSSVLAAAPLIGEELASLRSRLPPGVAGQDFDVTAGKGMSELHFLLVPDPGGGFQVARGRQAEAAISGVTSAYLRLQQKAPAAGEYSAERLGAASLFRFHLLQISGTESERRLWAAVAQRLGLTRAEMRWCDQNEQLFERMFERKIGGVHHVYR